MTPFWAGLLIGLFFGTLAGVFMTACYVLANRADESTTYVGPAEPEARTVVARPTARRTRSRTTIPAPLVIPRRPTDNTLLSS